MKNAPQRVLNFKFIKSDEERNAENLLVITDNTLAGRYIANWKVHWEHPEVYSGRAARR
jgi:hypothetical protein